MALPIITTPKFFTKMPSDGLEIAFRPFTVKEQKNLMIVQQGGDEATALKVLAECLSQCVDGDISIFNRPMVDFEWLFLQVRGKSVGEIIELSNKCAECGAYNEVSLNISAVEIPPFPNPKVQVNEDLVIEFRIVSLKDVQNVKEPEDLIASTVKSIQYKGETYTEFTKTEFLKFIEPLTLAEYAKIDEFFEKQPSLTLKSKSKCLKCGATNDVHLEGVFNFFR